MLIFHKIPAHTILSQIISLKAKNIHINELADQCPLISTPNDGADQYIIIYLKFQANDYTQSIIFQRFFIYFQKECDS